ncbi:hypothetical protein Pcinc_001149 [Petrolisthes cinctipes]|uniref:Uncharacterized protein n=1 Tax=Petrolisthes cinctipes TaxID=88211 RepID=A0AAE1L3E9_PETCI|nr:hypothetical protein Pcinc_001149 [Petrolisthes cinctipes]
MLYRRCDRVEIQDCKVIPGDHVTAQHRLVTLDLAIMVTQKQIEKRQGLKRIKWFKLKYPEKKMEFKERVLNELEPQIIDVEDWWNQSSGVILRVAREVLGGSTGKIIENKETWWFNEEVQQKTQLKKEAKKKHKQTREEADRVAYKQCNKEAKKAVAIAKAEAYDQLYNELETKEGQGKIFRLAKQRNKSTRDITHIRQMKDENGKVIRKESDIVERWKQYFEHLLNKENERLIHGSGDPNHGMVRDISKDEVELSLKKMKSGKAPGQDMLPVEAWKALGDEGVHILSASTRAQP